MSNTAKSLSKNKPEYTRCSTCMCKVETWYNIEGIAHFIPTDIEVLWQMTKNLKRDLAAAEDTEGLGDTITEQEELIEKLQAENSRLKEENKTLWDLLEVIRTGLDEIKSAK